jgi:hypothetical protein
MDVVGYKVLIKDQTEMLARLSRVTRGTTHFQKAKAEGKRIRLATVMGWR